MKIQTLRSRLKKPVHFYCPSGDGTRLQYMLKIDDDGCECLYCSGQTDQYAEIQSYRESCDLAMLLRNIDPMSLNNAISTYSVDDILNSGIMDYSTMPTSLGGMFNLVQQGENLFNGLPEEVRREFNYSVKNFVSKFGSDDFNNILNKYMAPSNIGGAFAEPLPLEEPKKKRGRPKKEDKEIEVNENESN